MLLNIDIFLDIHSPGVGNNASKLHLYRLHDRKLLVILKFHFTRSNEAKKKPYTETSLKENKPSVQVNCAMNCFAAIWSNGYKHHK